MNKSKWAAIALCAGIAFSCSPGISEVKGVITDATMNTDLYGKKFTQLENKNV